MQGLEMVLDIDLGDERKQATKDKLHIFTKNRGCPGRRIGHKDRTARMNMWDNLATRSELDGCSVGLMPWQRVCRSSEKLVGQCQPVTDSLRSQVSSTIPHDPVTLSIYW